MMYPFVDVVSKLEKKSRRYRVCGWILNIIAFSLLGYLLLLYISAPVLFAKYGSYDFVLLGSPVRTKLLCTAIAALVPAIILTFLLRRRPVDVIKRIGARYPAFSERLPTAYDNRGADGIIVNDLAWRVSENINMVKKSDIVSKKWLILMILISIGQVALISYMSSPDAPRLMTPDQLESLVTPADAAEREAAEDEAQYQQIMSEIGSDASSGTGDTQIYGKPSVAVIEGTNIELVMFSDAGVGHSSRRTEDKPAEFISGALYAANPVSAETYIDKLPEENRDLIRQYFIEMAEIE
ncbi:MAG: DUF7502 family protein [Candidatus Methanogasteraceae archaeon]